MIDEHPSLRRYETIAVWLIALAGLVLISSRNYLLFHSIAEVFSIVIAGGLFALAWNARRYVSNGYLLFLGVSTLFVAGIDLVHALAFQGLGAFPGHDANLPTQLWIAARYLQSFSLLASLVYLQRRLHLHLTLAAYVAVTTWLLYSIFAGLFPDCYVPGAGLTPFKKASEYIISAILLLVLILLRRQRQHLSPRVYSLISWTIVAIVLSEVTFTLYVEVDSWLNLLGHLLKIAAYAMLYSAVIETTIRRPFELVLRELKQNEDALRDSEAKYRAVVDRTTDGIVVVQDRLVRFSNPGAASMVGFSVHEMVGQPVAALIAEAERDRVMDLYERRMRGEDVPPIYDSALVHRDGHRVDVEVNAGLTEYGGQPADLIFLRDISERVRAEAQAQEAQATLEGILRAAPIGMGMVVDRTFVWTNDTLQRMVGYSADELQGQSARMLYESDDEYARVGEVKYAEVSARGVGSVETRFARRDGSFIEIRLSSAPLHPGQLARGVIFTAQDITEQKALQQRVARQERLAAIGQLAAGIAHDFNNLLTGIMGFGQLLLGNPVLDQPAKEDIGVILSEAQRGARLVQQMMDFAGRSTRFMSIVSISDLLQEIMAFWRRTLPENIAISLQAEPGDNRVRVDPDQIQQMLTNLALNARDAMPEGGRLSVEVASLRLRPGDQPPLPEMGAGAWLRISVSDTGQGLSPEAVAHLYEPFFTTKGLARGTGLGLAQVYGIVRQHEGHIDVNTELGRGTTFTIYLPAEPPTSEPAPPPANPGTEAQGRGETILLVEDEPQVLNVAQRALQSHGYEVLVARDGQEALDLCAQGARFDLVISDMVLPQMGAGALYQALRQRDPHARMLVISGYPEGMAQSDLRAVGVSRYLGKPFTPLELAQAVRQALDEPSP